MKIPEKLDMGTGMRYNLSYLSGCGSAWLERLVWDQEVAGSNPVTPIVEMLYKTANEPVVLAHY